jgi:hypothetical protein
MENIQKSSWLPAVCLSLLLHAVILILLPASQGRIREPSLSRYPLVLNLSTLRPVIAELDAGADRQIGVQQRAGIESNGRDAPEPQATSAETSIALGIAVVPTPTRMPEVRVPGLQTLRDAVREALPGEQSPGAPWLCTEQQRRSRLFDCPLPEADSGTHRDTVSRTPRTVALSFGEIDALSENLGKTGLANSEVTRQLNYFKAAAADLSGTGNVKLNALRDEMFRNDSTWQLKKRVLEPR